MLKLELGSFPPCWAYIEREVIEYLGYLGVLSVLELGECRCGLMWIMMEK